MINIDEKLYPLTEDNDTGRYGNNLTFIGNIIAFFQMIINAIKNFLNLSV